MLASTKRSEKCMKFNSAARVFNLFNDVRFSDTKTDLTIRHSTDRNKKNSYLFHVFDLVLWIYHCTKNVRKNWQKTAVLVTFTEEILNGKLHLLHSLFVFVLSSKNDKLFKNCKIFAMHQWLILLCFMCCIITSEFSGKTMTTTINSYNKNFFEYC